jgi:hypothetical protein
MTKTAQTAAKSSKSKTAVVVKKTALEKMAARTRMYFGSSYMNAVIGEFCKDHGKMIQHAIHLKVGSPSELKKLKLETLRAKLATAILAKEDGATPFSLKTLH